MSTKWHFDNNAERATNYKPLDTNPDHYKNRSYGYRSQDDYKEGVSITYIDGSTFRTKGATASDLSKAIKDGNKWFTLPNGGQMNLDYVIHFEPYKFFNQEWSRR